MKFIDSQINVIDGKMQLLLEMGFKETIELLKVDEKEMENVNSIYIKILEPEYRIEKILIK